MNSRIKILWLLIAALFLVTPKGSALELTQGMFQGKDFQPSIYGGKNKGYVFQKSQKWDPKKVPGYSLGYAEFAVTISTEIGFVVISNCEFSGFVECISRAKCTNNGC